MKVVELAGENGDLTCKRKFVGASLQQPPTHLCRRILRAQSSFSNEESDFPKADGADRKLRFRCCPTTDPPTLFSE